MHSAEQAPEKTGAYNAAEREAHWYRHWLKHDYFSSKPDGRKPYTVVIPPPNVTGVLHMGHMLNNTIQDALIRRARMRGYNACWVPGTDHASIATEAKVVHMLREKGIKKSDLTREEFLKYAWEWKEKYGGIILKQLKRLGASCDWNRETFTMDPAYYDAVMDVFIDLYEKGYIYRALRFVHWDCVAQTAISDEEVIYKEMTDKLFFVKYYVVDEQGNNTEDYITVATTRPETIPADQALATWPGNPVLDEKGWRGKRVRVPLLDRTIPIIEDEAVDKEFGTGWLKVTPWHDRTDREVYERYSLRLQSRKTSSRDSVEVRKVEVLIKEAFEKSYDTINDDGKMNVHSQLYDGLDRFDARGKSEELLQNTGLLAKTENLLHSVGTSERTGSVIEPKLKLQWWVDMKKIYSQALEVVMNDDVKLIPDKFKNTYRHWMENVKDWCISRQLWWGQQIPIYSFDFVLEPTKGFENMRFRRAGDEVAAKSLEEAIEKVKLKNPSQEIDVASCKKDPDVLDTWFSSWLWPMAVFDATVFKKNADGTYPAGNTDVNYYYPTADLVTAPEILFFWVARMIIAGMEFRKDANGKGIPPFKNVYLTGIVRDKQGRKMSKSLGNSPDPLVLMEKYGADGVRMGMLLTSPAGNDLPFDESQCEQGRNFINKLWNASKLIAMWEALANDTAPSATQRLIQDWMQARTAQVIHELNGPEGLYEKFRLSEALMTTYKLIWDDFCSWYLEVLKPQGQGLPRAVVAEVKRIFGDLLKLLHPFMPFITEELWHGMNLVGQPEDIIVAPWPEAAALSSVQQQGLADMQTVREIATAIRSLRTEKNIANKQPLAVIAKATQPAFYDAYLPVIARLVNLEGHSISTEKPDGAVALVVAGHELFIPLAGAIDAYAERARITKEVEYTEGFLRSVQVKLENEKFVANAKPDVLARERQKLADAEGKLAALRESLAALPA